MSFHKQPDSFSQRRLKGKFLEYFDQAFGDPLKGGMKELIDLGVIVKKPWHQSCRWLWGSFWVVNENVFQKREMSELSGTTFSA